MDTCRFSGFVRCSQDTWISTQVSLPVQPKSPTFPRSSSNPTTRPPKSPDFSEADQGDEEETDLGPECLKSPVFDRTQCEGSSSACKSHSGFMFSSQDSLTSSVRSSSCRPRSPVFPQSPAPQPKNSAHPQTSGRSTNPAFGRTRPRPTTHLDPETRSEDPSATELQDPQSLRQVSSGV